MRLTIEKEEQLNFLIELNKNDMLNEDGKELLTDTLIKYRNKK